MGQRINEAGSRAATEKWFSYKTEAPEPEPPAGISMTRCEWESLSPGYRRAISKEFAPPAEPPVPEPDQRQHKAAVEYAGRKRL